MVLRIQGSTCHKEIKKSSQRAKEDGIEQQCSDIEDSLSRCKTKRSYQTVKQLTFNKEVQFNAIKDKYGKCFTEEQKILKCWTEYCSELYNHKIEEDPSLLNCPQFTNEDECPLVLGEVETAVKKT